MNSTPSRATREKQFAREKPGATGASRDAGRDHCAMLVAVAREQVRHE
jgi:hypothetical protein